jgi:hypothetical protein
VDVNDATPDDGGIIAMFGKNYKETYLIVAKRGIAVLCHGGYILKTNNKKDSRCGGTASAALLKA